MSMSLNQWLKKKRDPEKKVAVGIFKYFGSNPEKTHWVCKEGIQDGEDRDADDPAPICGAMFSTSAASSSNQGMSY